MMKRSLMFFLAVLILATACFAAPLKKTSNISFVVAADGSGDFTSIQQAIDAIPDMRKVTTRILIKKGVYKEKIVLAESKQNVSFIGEAGEQVVICYDDFASKKNVFGEEVGTSGSAGFYIYGINICFENITFQNSAGPVGQAVAVLVAGDKIQFYNCRFLGFQDTLYTYKSGSRQYYNHCYIEGTVDFIFGSSTAVFDTCEIKGKQGGYFTAASTPQSEMYGYVFRHCTLLGDAAEGSFKLGRPWRPFAKVVFIECDLSTVVAPEGWDNWGNMENEKTAYYAEYKSRGEGADVQKRVPWSHQLTDQEVKAYALKHIFKDWEVIKF